jgi:cytoskeletal protein CcmA (bactofilin family)
MEPSAMSSVEKAKLDIDLQAENIVSVVSATSEVRGTHKNKSNEGVLIEGTYIGSIDVGDGTVAIAKNAFFVGSLRAGKLISDGHILKEHQGESAGADDNIDIKGTVVLGPSSLTEVDSTYGDLEVMRGARIVARVTAREATSARRPGESPVTAVAPAITPVGNRPAPAAPLAVAQNPSSDPASRTHGGAAEKVA